MLLVTLALLGVTIATRTPQLSPLVAGAALALLIAPFSSLHRARIARRGVLLEADALPRLSPVGEGSRLQISLTNRTERAVPSLAIEQPVSNWRRRTSTIDSGVSGPKHSSVRASRRLWERRIAPPGLVALPVPGAEARALFTSPVPFTQRGVFVLATSSTWARDPFGLFATPGPPVPSVTVVFHPPPDPEATWPVTSAGSGETDDADHSSIGARDGAGELNGIRPYVVGDRLSLIHWPARARYGAWFVRQFSPDGGNIARLLVDDRAGVHRRRDFERMLGIAQGLLDCACLEGRTVEMSTVSGDSVVLPPVPASLELGRTMLATLQPRRSGDGARWSRDVDAFGGTNHMGAVVLSTVTGSKSLPKFADVVAAGT